MSLKTSKFISQKALYSNLTSHTLSWHHWVSAICPRLFYMCLCQTIFSKDSHTNVHLPHHPLFTMWHQEVGFYITFPWIWGGLRLLQKWYCQTSKAKWSRQYSFCLALPLATHSLEPWLPCKEIWLFWSHHAEEILWSTQS